MNNIDLLDRILAPNGYFAVLGLKGKNPIQKLVATRQELNILAEEFVAEGRDAYFGCAKYATADSRKKENVQSLKAFWIDLDCGVLKAEVNEKTNRPDGYIDQETATAELDKFCRLIGLPLPLLVNSGRGIHAYWPLADVVTRAEWEPVAARLNELCVLHKLYVDASVFEAARVLRVPGTYNFKDTPPNLVSVIRDAEDVGYEVFKNILGVKQSAFEVKPTQELSDLAKALAGNTVSKFSKIMIRSGKGEGCNQLLYAYQNQDSIPEPLWFSALSVAHRCADRATAIHKLSDRHENYSAEDTEAKASHTEFAHSCATFEKHNAGGCEGCPWKGRIKSPISLGREIIKAEDTEVRVTEGENSEEYTIPSYPHPYFRGLNGGVYIMPEGEDETDPVCIYEHDIYVVKRMRDPDIAIGELALLRLHLPMDGVKEFTVPLSTISVKEKLREVLAINGVAGMPYQMKELANFVMKSIKELQYKRKAEEMRTQFGWADKDSKFIIGNREITKDGTFHSPPSAQTKYFADSMSPRGTLEKWKEVFNMYGAPGLEPNAFAALSAFGAPLLKFTGHKGAIINLIHKDSGTGKSTALYMCNSVYGHPDNLAAIAKDTFAAKMIQLGVMNNLPFTIDEITNMSPIDFSNLAYSMSQGRGANRAKSASNELRVNTTTWQTISVASSNASFYEKLGIQKSSPDGEMMRLLEYQVQPTTIIPPHVAKQMFDIQLKENYGHAGDIYAGYLVSNLEEAVSGMRAIQAKIDTELNLTNRERFWSAVVACNIAGGLMARNLGLIDWDMKQIYLWATTMIQTLREDVRPPVNDSSAIIGSFINRHMQSILVVNDEVDARTSMHSAPTLEPRGELIIRFEPDTKKMYIAAAPFRVDCVQSQIHYKDALNQLKAKGIYLGAMNKRLSKGMKIKSPGVHALVFDCSGSDFIDIENIVSAELDNANRAD